MRVEEIMTRDVATCRPDQSAADAARVMWDRDCGCVPITNDDGDLVGIVTDRDLCMAAYTRGVPLHEIVLGTAMTREVQTCRRVDSVRDVERRMSESQVRRVPVTGGAGRVVGIVSLSDVVRGGERSAAARLVEHLRGDVTRTFAAITEPRAAQAAQTGTGKGAPGLASA